MQTYNLLSRLRTGLRQLLHILFRNRTNREALIQKSKHIARWIDSCRTPNEIITCEEFIDLAFDYTDKLHSYLMHKTQVQRFEMVANGWDTADPVPVRRPDYGDDVQPGETDPNDLESKAA